MKILLLAPVHDEKGFLRQKKKLHFVEGQGQQSWLDALQRLGHSVIVFRYTDAVLIPQYVKVFFSVISKKTSPVWTSRIRRFFENNYYLLPENYFRTCKVLFTLRNKELDVIIISGGIATIFPWSIKYIKNKTRAKVLLFSGINPKISSTKIERKLIKSKVLDFVIENDSIYAREWKKIGAKQVMVLPISGVDVNLHKKVTLSKSEKSKFTSDICFVGSLTNERQQILLSLINFNLKIWGDFPVGVSLLEPLKKTYKGQIRGKSLVKAFNGAKIVLNFQPKDMGTGGNMRTFEIAGCGAFQLVDRYNRSWFREGKEIVVFKDQDDLVRKINYYLTHDQARKRIAKAGFLRAHKEHSYDERFKKLLEEIQ